MGISIKARHLPQRVATGAFILNSGIGKLSAEEATAAHLHGFAAGTYPFLKKVNCPARPHSLRKRYHHALPPSHAADMERRKPGSREPH